MFTLVLTARTRSVHTSADLARARAGWFGLFNHPDRRCCARFDCQLTRCSVRSAASTASR